MSTDLSWQDYDALPAVNWSTLKHLRESPLHYLHALSTPPKPPTPAMVLGTAVHYATLEPDRYPREVVVWGQGDRRGNPWKEFKAAHARKIILKPDEEDAVLGAAKAVRSHGVAATYLSDGEAEVTLKWADPRTGLECKGRVDWLRIDGDRAFLVDLKTTRTACPRRFATQAAKLGYHCQLAHYRSGIRALYPVQSVEVVIVAVESDAPHDVGVFLLDDDALYPGDEEVRELLDRLKRCVVEDRWPGRAPDLQRLELPAWVFPGEDDGDVDGLGLSFSSEED